MRELTPQERKDWISTRQGTDFMLFKGMVHLAHEIGLVGTSTEIAQLPTAENDGTAVMLSTVTFELDGKTRIFRCVGDANAHSVGRMIVVHIIRMAETRALARCLRLALDVGYTALEELGPNTEDDQTEQDRPVLQAPRPAQQQQNRPQQQQTQQAPRPLHAVPEQTAVPVVAQAGEMRDSGPATKQQIDRLVKLQAALGRAAQVPAALSFDDAAMQITDLVRIFNAQARGARR